MGRNDTPATMIRKLACFCAAHTALHVVAASATVAKADESQSPLLMQNDRRSAKATKRTGTSATISISGTGNQRVYDGPADQSDQPDQPDPTPKPPRPPNSAPKPVPLPEPPLDPVPAPVAKPEPQSDISSEGAAFVEVRVHRHRVPKSPSEKRVERQQRQTGAAVRTTGKSVNLKQILVGDGESAASGDHATAGSGAIFSLLQLALHAATAARSVSTRVMTTLNAGAETTASSAAHMNRKQAVIALVVVGVIFLACTGAFWYIKHGPHRRRNRDRSPGGAPRDRPSAIPSSPRSNATDAIAQQRLSSRSGSPAMGGAGPGSPGQGRDRKSLSPDAAAAVGRGSRMSAASAVGLEARGAYNSMNGGVGQNSGNRGKWSQGGQAGFGLAGTGAGGVARSSGVASANGRRQKPGLGGPTG